MSASISPCIRRASSASDAASIALLESAIAKGTPLGTVCHGPAALRHVNGPDGKPYVNGKSVTGFSNSEEKEFGTADIVPFLVEDMLKQNGGRYSSGANWQSHVVEDGLLVTGQNPASSLEAGKRLLALVARLVGQV